MGEPPIIPMLSRPMFAKKFKDKMKTRAHDPLKLNQIFRKYFMLDPGLRRDMNFNS